MKLFNHYLFHQKKNDSVSNPIAAVIEENSWNIAWIVALLVSIVQCLMPQKSGHSTKRLLGKVNLAAAPHPRYIWLSHKYWLHNIFSTTTKRVLLWTIFFMEFTVLKHEWVLCLFLNQENGSCRGKQRTRLLTLRMFALCMHSTWSKMLLALGIRVEKHRHTVLLEYSWFSADTSLFAQPKLLHKSHSSVKGQGKKLLHPVFLPQGWIRYTSASTVNLSQDVNS